MTPTRRPFLIGVGGAHSGSGKTTVICNLLPALIGFGAIKCTPTLLYSSVITDPAILTLRDKDTARYIESGAADAIWVQSDSESLTETLGMAMDHLSHLRGVIVEGNSAIELLKPDIVIFTLGEPLRFKERAHAAYEMADLILCREMPPEAERSRATHMGQDEIEEYIKCVLGVMNERKDRTGA